MIVLFNTVAPGGKDRIPQAYNGLTLNDETIDRNIAALYEVNIVAINDQWDFVSEPKTKAHGMEGYEPRKVTTLIREDGIIRAKSLPMLITAARLLNSTFDSVNTYRVDSATTYNRGYLPFTFSIPTDDTVTYPSGLIPAQYFVRALTRPIARSSQFEGLNAKFILILQAIDPRAYLQTLSSNSRSNVGALIIDNSKATFPSWPTVTLTFTGSGSGQVSFVRTGAGTTGTLTVDATGYVLNDVMVIDMERKTVKKNGIVTMSDWVSGPYLDQSPENTTWTIANITGTLAATVLVEWRRAFV